MCMRQNEFLFKETTTCTYFWAIFCKIQCVLVLNVVRFGAKRSVFWCKMECVLLLNASYFGAKRKAKCH